MQAQRFTLLLGCVCLGLLLARHMETGVPDRGCWLAGQAAHAGGHTAGVVAPVEGCVLSGLCLEAVKRCRCSLHVPSISTVMCDAREGAACFCSVSVYNTLELHRQRLSQHPWPSAKEGKFCRVVSLCVLPRCGPPLSCAFSGPGAAAGPGVRWRAGCVWCMPRVAVFPHTCCTWACFEWARSRKNSSCCLPVYAVSWHVLHCAGKGTSFHAPESLRESL